MTSLKLKELIFTAIQAQNYPIFDEVELQEDILNAVKEWLKQIQKENMIEQDPNFYDADVINDFLKEVLKKSFKGDRKVRKHKVTIEEHPSRFEYSELNLKNIIRQTIEDSMIEQDWEILAVDPVKNQVVLRRWDDGKRILKDEEVKEK